MSTPEKLIKPCYVLLQPVTPKVNIEFSSELKKAINERNLLTTKTRKRVTEALEEIEHENQECTRKRKKEKILNEILDSEEKYIRQLEVIMEFFIKPTQERNLLKATDFNVLFGELTSIYKINNELLHELHKSHNNVAKAFSKIAPFFKSYSFYALGYKKNLEFLQNCRRSNPEFEKFVEMQESRPEVQSKLSALLIVPIQRIPRYKLLLTSLFNLTSPSEQDYDSLLDSLRKVENAADHINQVIKEQENMQRLIELQRCLRQGEPNVITPGRHLLKEGQLLQLTDKSAHSQKMHVVLMNDIIMFCKMKRDELKVNSLKCCGIYPLNKCKVQKIQDKGAFKIICQQEEMVLYHDSYSATTRWIEQIENAIDAHNNDRKTLRKDSTVRRPVKRKDVHEYNEVGLSPGKKMKKRKTYIEESTEIERPITLARRRPLRTTFNIPTYPQSAASFLITLKPPELRETKENNVNENNHNELSRELFVFGQPHPDRGFSFKMNKWLCGIGSSVKKFFGFK